MGDKAYTNSKLLEIGLQKRQGLLKENWDELAKIYSNGRFKNGEQFRSWVKRRVSTKGTSSNRITIKPATAALKSDKPEEIQINADGSQEHSKITDFDVSTFETETDKLKDKNYLLKFHGFDPKQFKLVTARASKWEVATGNETEPIRIQFASKITVKPLDNELTEEKSMELYLAELEVKKQISINNQYKAEINKLIKNEANKDLIHNLIKNSIKELEKVKPLPKLDKKTIDSNGKVYANLLASDWHFGASFKNTLNEYNPEIFELRLRELINSTIAQIKRFGITDLIIGSLGDSIAGSIHVSTRVQSSEDVITQIMHVTERMSEMINELYSHVNSIKFINIMGNHSRLISDKQQALLNENIERITPWYLQARLGHLSKLEIVHGDDGYYIDNTFNEPQMYVHGDLDKIDRVVKTAPQMLNVIASKIYSGHIHHHTLKEHGKTIVISNGSMVGLDDYAVGGRFAGRPMQLFHVFTPSGDIDVQKPIYFDK